MRLETLPITVRSFEKDYHIDGDEFGRAYKDHISGFRTWTELDHADEWLIFPQNIGPHVSIDETCLSTGEVYTIVSNKDAHGRKGCIIAIVKGTKFCLEALQEVRREYRREQMTQDANAREGEFGNKAFNDIAAAMYDRENEILNYFVNRSTNASAESLNAKIKQFRALLRGIVDKKFFLFRLTKIYA